jgi:hypothetical protein
MADHGHFYTLVDRGGRRQPVTIAPENGERNPVIIGMCACVCVHKGPPVAPHLVSSVSAGQPRRRKDFSERPPRTRPRHT